MLKFSKVGVLLAALALCGLLVSSASAAEWHTNGPRTASSTSAGPSRLAIDNGPSTVVIGCTASSGHVQLNGPTSTAMPWLNAATVTPIFSGCTVSGGAGFTVACSPAELRANSYVGGITFATAGGGVTTGAITNIDCTLSIGPVRCATVTGQVPGHYINPNPIGTGAGRLTVTAANQQLEVEAIGAGCAAIPAGTGTFGSPGAGSSVQDLTYTVDGPNAPYIYRTP